MDNVLLLLLPVVFGRKTFVLSSLRILSPSLLSFLLSLKEGRGNRGGFFTQSSKDFSCPFVPPLNRAGRDNREGWQGGTYFTSLHFASDPGRPSSFGDRVIRLISLVLLRTDAVGRSTVVHWFVFWRLNAPFFLTLFLPSASSPPHPNCPGWLHHHTRK